MTEIKSLLIDILNIPSPTFNEGPKTAFIKSWFTLHTPTADITEYDHSLIVEFNPKSPLPHLCLVGHSDTVPPFFTPYDQDGLIYGSGASDMQAGVVGMMEFIRQTLPQLTQKYKLSFILYPREEGTGLTQNGLYSLIQKYPDYFKSIDLAIVGEPTNLTVQLGCVGSIHINAKIPGKASHSARPWDGVNAIYQSLPFLNAISAIAPVPIDIANVRFYDVIQVTEYTAESGRTTLPSVVNCNINYRFAPRFTLPEAEAHIQTILTQCGASPDWLTLTDSVPGGAIITSPLLTNTLATLGVETQAKQAWTDVAQLAGLGISAFNFGPGLTAQAHRPDEHVPLKNIETYITLLKRLL